MPRSDRKRRQKLCLLSCFSAPSVRNPDELEFPQDGSPVTYLSRLRSLSRTVPLAEFAGDGGKGYQKISGEMQSEEAPAWLSPAGSQDKGLLQKSRRFGQQEKRTVKTTIQSLTPTPARTHMQQSVFCHVSTKLNSRSQPPAQLYHARDPLRTAFRTIHPVTPRPNGPAGPAPSPAWSARRLDAVTGFLVVSATMTIMLFFGRLCAVLCNCACFYLLSCIQKPAPPSPAKARATDIDGLEEVDLDSPEYKKKVVLMGLLERNRYGVSGMLSPMASPSTARLC